MEMRRVERFEAFSIIALGERVIEGFGELELED